MIPNIPEITIFRIPLTTAGETILRQKIAYFHLWRYESILDGSSQTDGELSAVFGAQGSQDDAVPFSYNSRIQLAQPVDMVKMTWAAQTDRRAVILVAPRGEGIDGTNVPARQIVTPDQGAVGNNAVTAVTSGTRATILAGNVNRLRAVVQAPLTNTAPLYVGTASVVNLPTQGIILDPGASFEFKNYSGVIFALAQSGTQNARTWEERSV